MGNRTGKIKFIILFMSGVVFFSGCDKLFNRDFGFLEGKISIGPLCPVERIPPDPGCLPTIETYKAYPVSVWTSNGKREVARLNPELDGSFRTELMSGHYLVILENDRNRPGGSTLPAEIDITGRDTTILNIDIDTGIR
jgi:hypothetical protein